MKHRLSTLACAALVVTLALEASAASDDYLPPDLRSRVEQLKVDRTSIPTRAANLESRAVLTWEWLNAYAMNGGYVPVNATQIIAAILGSDGEPLAPQLALVRALDETIHELAFLDDNPEALGTLVADTGPFQAGSVGTITQTYTVGKRPIQTGGAIMVARHFMAGFGAWQTSDPAAPNYISISSSNARVSFVVSSMAMRGMHGGFRGSRPTLVFKVASGTLAEGDQITVHYGDTRGGSPGMTMPTFSSDRMPLPLYLAFRDNGHFFSLPIQPVRVSGATIGGVAGFAPSVVRSGESFELSIRAQDAYYNRAVGDIPDWRIMRDGKLIGEIPATGAITLSSVSLSEPGPHHLSIESADGSVRGEVNPILVSDRPRPQIFWGDTHGHSGFAEGIGTPERFMEWARDDARLDYVTHSEHDIWLDDAEWEVLRDNVSRFTEEGRFIAYLGYEWSVNTTRGGHHNVLFRTPENRNRIGAQFYPTLSRLYQGLRANADTDDVVVIPHAHQAGDYRMNDPELEPLVEIMSQHGSFEWFGRMYLNHGHRVGFTAASDNHLSQPGYSAPLGGSLSQRGGLGAVLAEERTVGGIFDGMKALRAYATTGDRIILDFDVNDTGMGQRGPFAETRSIKGRVIGTAPIDTITVVKNDEEIWQRSYLDAGGDRLNKSEVFMLTFSSASDPFHRGDNPRGWRAWEGTLEVFNADLVSIEPMDSGFPLQEVTVSEDANRVTFATKTRGDKSSYLLRLNNVQRTTRLQFDLVESGETGGAPPIYRPPQRVPADSFSLALRDLADGRISHTQPFQGYTDTTTLRRVITDGPKVVAFDLEDTSARQGDYYFVRVVQANDAIAWSSPVWIGGHSSR